MEIEGTFTPGRPHADLDKDLLAALGDDRKSFIGRHVRYGDIPLVVDSVSDLGDGRWRMRFISPE